MLDGWKEMATPIPENHCIFEAAEIVDATRATFSGSDNLRTQGVSIDSRSLRPGALFVALRGARDGHEFIPAAAVRGAAAAIVERGRRQPALPCFEVDDSLLALGALARRHLERTRKRRTLPVVAIGGAAGKTTTKELAASLMRAIAGDTLATPGNLNNRIGVPMTLLTLTDEHRAAVIECGTNQRGEIAALADIVKPEVALVLNIDVEHTEGLGSLSGVADEEAALFTAARVGIVGTAEKMLAGRLPAAMNKMTFGSDPHADVRIVGREVIAPGRQRIKLELTPWMLERDLPPLFEAELNLLGGAPAENAAAALAAVAAAWGKPLRRPQLDAFARALASVAAAPGRLSTQERAGVVIINDTYNANPRSVRAALAAARETADGLRARLIIALGDMLELGELSAQMHRIAVSDVLSAHPDWFVATGSEFARVLKSLPGTTVDCSRICLARDSRQAAVIVLGLIRRGDVLLVKGSRGIEMERVIDALSTA